MNKISELRQRVKSGEQVFLTTADFNQLQTEWIVRSKMSININQLKADAISEMIGKMPAIGFSSERERNNWIGDYIHELEQSA